MTELDGNNDYALNVKEKVIHISIAESGRKGYFCLGCKGELQAVISTKKNRISYFRHDSTDVEYKTKCTYSDETHRHKLAKEILQRIKKIKVPSLYKYPPKGEDGLANLLHDAKIIEAHSIGIERCFYENEEGEIIQGRSRDADDKYLLIQPDVTFFDSSGKPILFVELVATHKVNVEKLIKIKRLGIDTIEVIIPKSSPQEIEDTFFKSTKTKWIYNVEEERNQYVRVSKSNAEGILSIDELQRILFEETYKCRTAQVSNLIRAIRKCLGAKPYEEIERGFGEEISRVEGNSKREQERNGDINREKELVDNSRDDYFQKTNELGSGKKEVDSEFGSIEKRETRIKGKTNNGIKNEFGNEDIELDKRIEDLRRILGLLNDIERAQKDQKRYTTALRFFNEGTYKNWNK